MLATAEQLAAGLGASVVKAGGIKKRESQVFDQGSGARGEAGEEKLKSGPMRDAVGNAHLRLWIGERSLGERLLLPFCSCSCSLNIDCES